MPRIGRQASSSGYYHVMISGSNKEFVFRSDDERWFLLELLCDQQTSDKLELVAWCIMNNHLHTIVKAELETLSRAIKVINLKYAARYNRMHRRVGPVFGDRYRSEAIEDDAYLLGALRYLHLNKVSVLGRLGGSVRGFTEFHRQSDLTLYLETSKDR